MMKKLHFTGIGGAGMAPLAELSLANGFTVSGSDMENSAKCHRLHSLGAKISIGHRQENLPEDAAMLIYSSAVPENNPERVKARALNIPELRRGEYLAHLAANYRRVVAVTGTHGKSSITALLAKILQHCGKEPGFMIGAEVAGMANCAAGNGDIFVTEADESDGTHTKLKNFLAVIPNIEDDHEWSLGGKEVLENNFRLTAKNSQQIIFYASENCDRLLKDHPQAVRLSDMPGKLGGLRGFQAANAYIAIQTAVLLGCDEKSATDAAMEYPQVARRMTIHCDRPGLTVIEDYAHHPTEVRAAIELLRATYRGCHLRILFQPHRFARLEKYFAEFVTELSNADSIYIAPVFAAWSESGKVDSAMLAKAVNGIAVSGSFEHWAEEVVKDLPPDTVIAILGAGDINKVIPLLVRQFADKR
ncbi:MAG: hypothetical protein E7053_00485 [Lentisphaerae bacterium]|nr:hypothetical protein [Lentisphaerota bacterium]